MLWGYTPALDLIKETNLEDKEELNVLLVGCFDPRHILKTISNCYRHSPHTKVNFFVMEPLLETVARNILLLLIGLEPSEKLGLREKTSLWMEVYGNTLLRPVTATYIFNKCVQLVHMITDFNFLSKRMPLLDLSLLKYKERDGLENIFKFWLNEKFPLLKIWDHRLRKSLETRYDSRDGVFDWDYHMRLKDLKSCDVINSREYINWRRNGVAFTWPEVEASIPNPTFAVGIFREGDRLIHCGFHGEMTYGPFFAFGLNSEDSSMMKKMNGVYTKRATDITQRNLFQIFHEIEKQTPYETEREELNYGLAVTQIGTVNINDDPDISREVNNSKEEHSSISIPHSVNFFPISYLKDLSVNKKFVNFFDMVYISSSLFPKCTELMTTAKKDAALIIETKKIFFMVDKNDRNLYGEEIKTFAKKNNFESVFEFDPCEDFFAYFKGCTL